MAREFSHFTITHTHTHTHAHAHAHARTHARTHSVVDSRVFTVFQRRVLPFLWVLGLCSFQYQQLTTGSASSTSALLFCCHGNMFVWAVTNGCCLVAYSRLFGWLVTEERYWALFYMPLVTEERYWALFYTPLYKSLRGRCLATGLHETLYMPMTPALSSPYKRLKFGGGHV
jgi:hypothetical protein